MKSKFSSKHVSLLFAVLFLAIYYFQFNVDDLFHSPVLIACTVLFPCIISFLWFRRVTILGFFAGFILQWVLFLNVNPYPLQQDNKLAIMSLIPKTYRPETQFSLTEIQSNVVVYPIIIKPTICSGEGMGITILQNETELNAYMAAHPNTSQLMVQSYLENYPVEIGVCWEKRPWEKEGRVLEIVEKTQQTSVRKFDYHQYKDHSDQITPALNQLFNAISQTIPNMNVCRYDIRLPSIDHLQKGDFKIVEVNGTMGMRYLGYPIGVLPDVEWYLMRIFMGIHHLVTLQGYSPLNLAKAMYTSYINAVKCHDWENLYSLYS